MAREQWPLLNGRPMVQVGLTFVQGGQPTTRKLLADTGAGRLALGTELILEESDCILCSGLPVKPVLGGAYSGSFPVHLIRIQVASLAFDQFVPAVGVSSNPKGFDGVACFPFLNRFSYGNFADSSQFALEI